MAKIEKEEEEFQKKPNRISKFFINIWKKIDRDDRLSPVQQLAFDIFEICLNDDDNVRYLNSKYSYKKYIVSKRFILEKDVSTFILLESGKLTIINHQYRYDVDIPEKTSQKMNRMFDDKVEQDRTEMEKEILGNITSSLQIVLADFKGKLEETRIVKKRIAK
jgi:hypothetical protein